MWTRDPTHPSLHFKRVDDDEPVYSVRVTGDIRALGLLEAETLIWFWIGDHDEYLRLLKDL